MQCDGVRFKEFYPHFLGRKSLLLNGLFLQNCWPPAFAFHNFRIRCVHLATIIRLLFYGNVDKVWTFWRNSIRLSTLIPGHKFLVYNLHIWGRYMSCGPSLPAFMPNCRYRFTWHLKTLTDLFTQVPNIAPSIK